MFALPTEKVDADSEFCIVDNHLVDFHERANKHVAVFAKIILESEAFVESAVARWQVFVFEIALRVFGEAPGFLLVGTAIDAVPNIIGAANAEGKSVVVDLEHDGRGYVQAADERIVDERNGFFSSACIGEEIAMMVVVVLLCLFEHAFCLARIAKI